jgi:FkbM family methyltransferase
VAFEPDAELAHSIEAAAERNGLENVELRRIAVWSSPGSLPFTPHAESPEGFHGSVDADGTRSVPATTLDVELTAGPAPDLVKIDVEGAEEEVLNGAKHLLQEVRPTILCEVHVTRFGRPGRLEAIRHQLVSAGYEVTQLPDHGRSTIHLLARRSQV